MCILCILWVWRLGRRGVSPGELDDEDGGGPGHVVADPAAPHRALGVPGLPRTPMVSTRPPSVWHCWHHADLILLRGLSMQPPRVRWRISRSLGAYFFAPPGSKSIVSRSQSHRLFFINIQTFPIAFKCSVKMKKSYKNIQINFWKIVK